MKPVEEGERERERTEGLVGCGDEMPSLLHASATPLCDHSPSFAFRSPSLRL
jgi:hypothetical protein